MVLHFAQSPSCASARMRETMAQRRVEKEKRRERIEREEMEEQEEESREREWAERRES